MKILVVGPAWVGDMVIAQGLFKALKKSYPHALIDVLAPDWTRALLSRMPQVNQAISLPFQHGELNLKKRFQLGRSLKKFQYTHAYVLPNSWKSALVPFFACIPHRIGFRGEMRVGLLNHVVLLDKNKYPQMIDRFLALHPAFSSPHDEILPQLKIDKKNYLKNIEKFHLGDVSSKKIAVLCPGAEFGSSKRWPEKYYANIAHYFFEKNYAVWLMGSQKDQPVTQEINALTQNRCNDFSGKTTLDEAVDLLSMSDIVITNDSGLMHIAAALDKNMIVLYGSTSSTFTPPLTPKAQCLYVDPTLLKCRPCFKRQCPLGHHKCMENLTPAIVKKAIEKCVF